MRIVLIGATGFVGRHLLPELSSAGHECIVLSRYRPACKDLAVIPRSIHGSSLSEPVI